MCCGRVGILGVSGAGVGLLMSPGYCAASSELSRAVLSWTSTWMSGVSLVFFR